MTNSTWTQEHIQSLLARGKNGWLAALLLMDDETAQKRAERGEGEATAEKGGQAGKCSVLFPPCDTGGLVGFELEGRGKARGIVSLAQFR